MKLGKNKNISIGDFTYGKPQIVIYSKNDVCEIGRYCSIAKEVTIMGGGDHRTDWVTTYPLREIFDLPGANQSGHPVTKGPTIVGNDVWIGRGAVILSGVTVGDGAVVGAYAVVTKDVPPYSIVAGNPARHIRFRFDEEQIKKLLAIRWWDWPLEKVIAHVDILNEAGLDKFFSLFGNDTPQAYRRSEYEAKMMLNPMFTSNFIERRFNRPLHVKVIRKLKLLYKKL